MEQKNNLIPLVILLGPTSAGKTDMAIELARECNGEIVSADSRQVYRGMDIGSGKATSAEQQMVPHYLLDVASPKERFTLAQYKHLADRAIEDIHNRGKLPFLVGGTPLYIQAVVDNYEIPTVSENSELREQLNIKPIEELLKDLNEKDSEVYERIDKHNKRRVVRALEILASGNVQRNIKGEQRYNPLIIGIDVPRKELYERIDTRVDARMKQGMIEEVQRLIDEGVTHERMHEFGQEYRFCSQYIKGEWASKEEMIQRLKFAIHGFARRQLVWFRKEKRIRWVKDIAEARKLIAVFLGK